MSFALLLSNIFSIFFLISIIFIYVFFLIFDEDILKNLLLMKIIFFLFKYFTTLEFLPFLSYPFLEKTTKFCQFNNFFPTFPLVKF